MLFDQRAGKYLPTTVFCCCFLMQGIMGAALRMPKRQALRRRRRCPAVAVCAWDAARARGGRWGAAGKARTGNEDGWNKLRVCSLLKIVSWSGAWEVFVVFSKTWQKKILKLKIIIIFGPKLRFFWGLATFFFVCVCLGTKKTAKKYFVLQWASNK